MTPVLHGCHTHVVQGYPTPVVHGSPMLTHVVPACLVRTHVLQEVTHVVHAFHVMTHARLDHASGRLYVAVKFTCLCHTLHAFKIGLQFHSSRTTAARPISVASPDGDPIACANNCKCIIRCPNAQAHLPLRANTPSRASTALWAELPQGS